MGTDDVIDLRRAPEPSLDGLHGITFRVRELTIVVIHGSAALADEPMDLEEIADGRQHAIRGTPAGAGLTLPRFAHRVAIA